MKISTRSRTAPFLAMDVLAEAVDLETAGADVIHLEIGEPAHGAPQAARAALIDALGRGEGMGYTAGTGRADLRAAIAGLYARRQGIEIAPERIIVTAGSSAGFSLAFLTLFDAGARVAIADPSYPCYRNILSALGLVPVRLEATIESAFQPTPAALDALAEGGALSGLLVASPANPTGSMLGHGALADLAAWCAARRAALISDEIYHGLSFGAPATSALEITDDVIVINSFSKYHAMTGWRIGWMVVPEAMARPMETLAQNLFICASHAGQIAALGAMSEAGEAEVAAHLAGYRANRDAVLEALASLDFTEIAPADGAFYAYATLPASAPDSPEFCRRLLADAKVATTPGLDFDPARGHRTVRFSFAQAPGRVAEGVARLRAFMGGMVAG